MYLHTCTPDATRHTLLMQLADSTEMLLRQGHEAATSTPAEPGSLIKTATSTSIMQIPYKGNGAAITDTRACNVQPI